MEFLKVGELKELLKDIPDDYDVTVVHEDFKRHIMRVTSVGILECDEEEHNAFCLYPGENRMINEETEFCKEVIFPKN